jgi:flagellar protein FliS
VTTEALNSYARTKFNTASRGDLLLAMYDGALRYGQIAREAIEAHDTAGKGTAISSLLAIIGELSNTLDHSKSPALCANLTKLYAYYIERIQLASLRMDNEPLDEVINQLRSLRETWAQAVQIAEHEGLPGGASMAAVGH